MINRITIRIRTILTIETENRKKYFHNLFFFGPQSESSQLRSQLRSLGGFSRRFPFEMQKTAAQPWGLFEALSPRDALRQLRSQLPSKVQLALPYFAETTEAPLGTRLNNFE